MNSRWLLSLALLTSACTVQPTEEEGTSEESSEVQTAYKGRYFTYDKSTSGAVRATGAIFAPKAPRADGIPVRGTCGVTFISQRYAITAAHCVDEATSTTPLSVEQYDISAVTDAKLSSITSIGYRTRFPNFAHGNLSTADGYKVTRYNSCTVVARCNSSNPINCTLGADIALVRCADRPYGSSYLPVAETDPPINSNIEMTWFHEVYSMVTAAPTYPTTPDRWVLEVYYDQLSQYNDYTMLQSGQAANYHYLGGNYVASDGTSKPRNQLLPLKATPFESTPLRVLGWRNAKERITTLLGCHGTSGSGVLRRNASNQLELLGPMIHGTSNVSSRLCATGFDLNPQGQKEGFGFTDRQVTRDLAQLAYNDWREWLFVGGATVSASN